MSDYGILDINYTNTAGEFHHFSIETGDCKAAVFVAKAVLSHGRQEVNTVTCAVRVYNRIGDTQDVMYQGSVRVISGSYNDIQESGRYA